MIRFASNQLKSRRKLFTGIGQSPFKTLTLTLDSLLQRLAAADAAFSSSSAAAASNPSLSIWRRKKEMGKEGLLVVQELKRLQSDRVRLDRVIRTRVSRLVRTDLLAVLAEFQRQGQVFLCMKGVDIYLDYLTERLPHAYPQECAFVSTYFTSIMESEVDMIRKYGAGDHNDTQTIKLEKVDNDLVSMVQRFGLRKPIWKHDCIYDLVRKEIWYHPDMFLYRDMLLMLARNKKVDESMRVWEDLKREEVLFDQHTFGNIVRSFLDSGLPSQAMEFYDEMKQSPDPPLCLPYRVILKGLIPYPELREKVKEDFLELFPDMSVYDPPEDLFDDQR